MVPSTPAVASAVASIDPDAGGAAFANADAPPELHPFRREEWEVAIGKWTFDDASGEVESDGKSMSSLMYFKGFRARDFELAVDVKFLKNESSAGILFREVGLDFYEDATFYQFEQYTRGSHHDRRLSLMYKSPYWIQIVEPKYPVAPYDVWQRFRVRAEGDHLECFLDGERVFDKHDSTLMRGGRVGLHVFQPRSVRFRDFSVHPL